MSAEMLSKPTLPAHSNLFDLLPCPASNQSSKSSHACCFRESDIDRQRTQRSTCSIKIFQMLLSYLHTYLV